MTEPTQACAESVSPVAQKQTPDVVVAIQVKKGSSDMTEPRPQQTKKQNPGVLAAVWLASIGGGIFFFTLFFKMAMENLQHGGTSWASAKDDLISVGVGIGVFSLIVRFAIIQPIINYLEHH